MSTDLTYDARLRLLTTTINTAAGPITTRYTYDAAGNPVGVTSPDGSAFANTYDAAHRLTGLADLLGQSIAYTLDAHGDRTQIGILDSTGKRVRTRADSYDAQGRLQRDTGGTGQATNYSYDANGNRVTITNPLTRLTTQAFDALDRAIRVTDPARGVVSTSYDTHERPTSITDPNGGATTYVYDGFGNVVQRVSPDTSRILTVTSQLQVGYGICGDTMQTFRIFVLALSVAAGAALAQDRPTGIEKAGGISLLRSQGKVSIGSGSPVESATDIFGGGFQSTDYSKLPPPPDPPAQIGACFVSVLTATPPASNPGVTTPLDAGPVWNLTGPKGSKQFPANKLTYGGILGGGVVLNIPGFPAPPPLYLDPGTYTVDNGAGGADIGPFQATVVAPDPQFQWTNADSVDPIDRSAGVDITWTGGDPAAKVAMTGSVALIDSAFKVTGGGAFSCIANVSDGHFFIAPEVLAIMPASPAGPSSAPLSTLTVSSGVSTKFDAPGSDLSLFSFQAGSSRSVVYK